MHSDGRECRSSGRDRKGVLKTVQSSCTELVLSIFTAESLDESSAYPCYGSVRCCVIERWTDALGRGVAKISTATPDGVETLEGQNEFIVLEEQFLGE